MTRTENTNEVSVMFPEEVQEYISSHRAGSYTLLDVRQPFEYENSHLPGAKLIPLPELADSLDRLDKTKPIMVYCAVGGRSRMAAKLLMHQGFQEVHNIAGGIEAWENPTVGGPVEFHMEFVRGDESPQEMILLGYKMEEGLRRFHEAVRNKTEDEAFRSLLNFLIKAEENHKKRLISVLSEEEIQQIQVELSQADDTEIMEGGIDIDAFMESNKPYLQSVTGYLELAMMVETQALDLYLRMADVVQNDKTRRVLFSIADEEKAHLASLGRVLEEKAHDMHS